MKAFQVWFQKHPALLMAFIVAGGFFFVSGFSKDKMQVEQDTFWVPQSADPYFKQGLADLKRELAKKPNPNRAKNIILFIADGNGISTVTATRIYQGQLAGNPGEEHSLVYDKFPYMGLVKTYNTNRQVPDSAGTSTAMHSGVKTKAGVVGVDATVKYADHPSSRGHHVASILELAEKAGMSTGVVSTTRVTHATPACAYAHSANRNWEDDKDFHKDEKSGGKDIARQLIEFSVGNGLEVAMGGGRRSFIPVSMPDPEDASKFGERQDGRDLTKEWVGLHENAAYVWNKKQFDAVDPKRTDHLLGLFNPSHMEFEADRAKDKGSEPSLAQMTAKAIEILSKNPEGYYLMVESGRVDHAHHANNAYRSLTDGVAFAGAVQMALDKTDSRDTLIIVTADHSHVLTISGYPARGNPILGLVYGVTKDGTRRAKKPALAKDGKPYTTLGYANGPGGYGKIRPDLSGVDTTDINYIQQAAVPMRSDTHSGEDVAVYATGPWAHLFQGTYEQSFIFHVMDYAGQIRNRAAAATDASGGGS